MIELLEQTVPDILLEQLNSNLILHECVEAISATEGECRVVPVGPTNASALGKYRLCSPIEKNRRAYHCLTGDWVKKSQAVEALPAEQQNRHCWYVGWVSQRIRQ
jgi:hypothetical protein